MKNTLCAHGEHIMNRTMHYPVTHTVRMTQETKEKLDKVAKAMNLAHSELIRTILEDYLK